MNIYLLSTRVGKWRGASELGESPRAFGPREPGIRASCVGGRVTKLARKPYPGVLSKGTRRKSTARASSQKW